MQALHMWLQNPDFRNDVAFLRTLIAPDMDPMVAASFKDGNFGKLSFSAEISPGITVDDFQYHLKAIGLEGRYRQLVRRPNVLKAAAERTASPSAYKKYLGDPDIAELGSIRQKVLAHCISKQDGLD